MIFTFFKNILNGYVYFRGGIILQDCGMCLSVQNVWSTELLKHMFQKWTTEPALNSQAQGTPFQPTAASWTT